MWIRTFIITVCTCLSVLGEIIPNERRTDWTTAGVVGGIPDSSGMTVYVTRSPGVSLATLNADLAACPSNQVVQLNAGVYSFASVIDFGQNEGVILRGAGEDQTFIDFTSNPGGANIHIGNETINRVAPPAGNIKSWTAGFAQDTTTITLSSVSGLPGAGHLLVLDQLNNNVWVDDDVQEGCSYCGRDAGERAQAQYVRITGVNGNDVSIEPGLHMHNWDSAYTPEVFYWTDDDTKMCGVEDFTMTNQIGSGLYAIYITQAQNCWVKNVTIQLTPQAAIATSQVMNVEVRHSSMLSSQSAASQSYGVIWYMASDSMMIDCIAANITGSMNYSPQAQGCVVAYNYFTNNIYDPSNWNIAALASHDSHVCKNLTEGNWANDMFYDSIHGSASHNTDLRNYYHGKQVQTVNNTIAYAAQQMVMSNNVVGNVLGTVGYHDWYLVDSLADFSPHFNASIFRLGEGNAGDGIPFDTSVAPSTLIHGNYDTVNDAITWDGGIADHTIPNSYFLASKPAWFGTCPWPPYDSANPTANSPTNIPAGYRFAFGTDPPAESGATINRSLSGSITIQGTVK